MASQSYQPSSDDEDDIDVNGDQHKDGVSLGVLAGSLSDDYLKDETVSRVGGPPIWCSNSSNTTGNTTALNCKLCKAPLFMVAQIYAPFGVNRALHIFGCNNAKCSKNKGSYLGWVVS